jgi:hypothetical protein
MGSTTVEEGDLWVWKGDSDPDLAIAGHSHRSAYRAAIREGLLPSGLRAVTLERPKPGMDITADSAYWQMASQADAEALILVWTGNQHNASFMLRASPPLRLYDSAETEGVLVPAAMVSARWAPTFEALGNVVPNAIAEHVVVVGTPPPKSEAAIRAGLGPESVFAAQIEASGYSADTIPLTPGPVRMSLWRVLQEDIRARVESLEAIFVGVPERARTEDGFLRPEYSAADATHANAAFGAMMIEEVVSALERKRTTGKHRDE